MDFLYYISGDFSLGNDWKAALSSLELGYAFEAKPVCSGVHPPLSPDKGHGVLLRSSSEQPLYDHETQVWSRCGERVWVGHGKGALPTPKDLRREQLLHGEDVRLSDGRIWHVPIAVEWDDELSPLVALPPEPEYDWKTKTWRPGGISPAHETMWQAACWWHEQQRGDNGKLTSVEFYGQSRGRAVDVLSAQYRVGSAECHVLGILGSDSAALVLNTALSLDSWVRLAEKKISQSETSSASPGQEDSNQDFAHQSENSSLSPTAH